MNPSGAGGAQGGSREIGIVDLTYVSANGGTGFATISADTIRTF